MSFSPALTATGSVFWAGGSGQPPRYTALLDALAPGGQAEQEMSVHRAIWALAEREVISVSPHGVVSAVQRGGALVRKPLSLPATVNPEQSGNTDDQHTSEF